MPKVRKIVFSLAMSAVADVYLLFPGMFMHVLAALLSAQVLLFFAFSEDLTVRHVRLPELLMLLVIGVMSGLFYLYVRKSRKFVERLALLVYTGSISLMLWTASLQAVKYNSPATVGTCVGAFLLYSSYVMLAVTKFTSTKIPHSYFIIMSSYYTAQYLICYSTVLSE